MPRSPRPLRDGDLADALGVTRVARLTGLDRTGVEVASAIRPGAHVLQVTNGKGSVFAAARVGALLEAAELWAAERPVPTMWDSAAALAARLGAGAVVAPEALGAAPGASALRMAWCAGQDLLGGGAPARRARRRRGRAPSAARPRSAARWRRAEVLVPAHAVFCPPAGAPLLGPAVLAWTSNGMGAAPDRDAALLHALLEAAERDALARALPEGFTARELSRRLLDPASLRAAAPRAAALAAALASRGLHVHLLDATAAVPLPCAAAVIVDAGGPVPVAAGYACRLRRDDALVAALLEAAQSRATEIHGAREDVLHGDRAAAAPLGRALARARPRRDARSLPDVRAAGQAAAVRAVLARLARAGVRRVVAVDLDAPAGVHVVKVLAPGLLLSELL